MKRTGKSALFYALLILALGINTSFEAIAQNKIVASKKSNFKVLSKEPILELDLKGDKFQLGKPIELTLTIRNETDSTIFLFDTVPERSFDITIKNVNGTNLEPTKEGRKKMYPNIVMGRAGAYIEAGKALKLRKIRLDELFDLKRAGNYALEVKRTYYFQDNSGKNTVSESEVRVLTSVAKFVIK